jgi:hypothetical protein
MSPVIQVSGFGHPPPSWDGHFEITRLRIAHAARDQVQ